MLKDIWIDLENRSTELPNKIDKPKTKWYRKNKTTHTNIVPDENMRTLIDRQTRKKKEANLEIGNQGQQNPPIYV